MVCLGNICRSPLAHGIMEELAKREGLDWEIDSAARVTGILAKALTAGQRR